MQSRSHKTSISELLNREGSDKGKWYGGLYDVLLQPQRQTLRCLLEIGIGTLIPNAPSSMAGWAGQHYRPGGSLRAWRDFFPHAEVFGVDVAADTQFAEERIQTLLCDSTSADQVAVVVANALRQSPELIIDDGLHEFAAQINTMKNFMPFLSQSGLYIVEDVVPQNCQKITDALQHINPGCYYFIHQANPSWYAIVIRQQPPI